LGASIKSSLFSAHLDCQDVIAKAEAGRLASPETLKGRTRSRRSFQEHIR
jgi:hypothetical protein